MSPQRSAHAARHVGQFAKCEVEIVGHLFAQQFVERAAEHLRSRRRYRLRRRNWRSAGAIDPHEIRNDAAMNKPFFDQYYRYDEMTQLLRDFTQAFTN